MAASGADMSTTSQEWNKFDERHRPTTRNYYSVKQSTIPSALSIPVVDMCLSKKMVQDDNFG